MISFIDPSKCWSASKTFMEHKELMKSMKENDENLEEISKKSKLEISMEKLMSYDKKTKKELIDEEIEMKKERLLDLTV